MLLIGSLPNIHDAVKICTQARTSTAVASQVFMFSVPLKKSPLSRIEEPVGSWTLP